MKTANSSVIAKILAAAGGPAAGLAIAMIVQYMLALNRLRFLFALAAVAIIEPVLLLQAPAHPSAFALIVLAVQALGAVCAFALAFRRVRT